MMGSCGSEIKRAIPAIRRMPMALHLVLISAALCSVPRALMALEDTGTPASWQVCFSPHGGCTDAIVEAIRGAYKQILVQAYEMTSPPIKSALVTAHQRGVEVTAIFDPEAVKERDTMVGELASAGIPIFIDSAHIPGLAHNKVMVIDQAVVITGSFNFTRAAENRNAENLLIIHSPALAAQYAHNFAAHLAHSAPLSAASIPAPRPYHRYYHHRHYYEHSYW
jgi:phosphatidylserine/phosphatidylglycerophosphate/cardiolipin synthase-like enzyme